MASALVFPKILKLRGHFVDENGKKWTVDVPHAVLESHFHQEEPIGYGSIYLSGKTTSQYCLRLLQDEKGAVLNIKEDEGKIEE